MTISFEEIKARLLANPEVLGPNTTLSPRSSRLLRSWSRPVYARASHQAELARRMGTSQSAIARLESGQTLPSTKTLLRYAEATGSKFHLRLSAA